MAQRSAVELSQFPDSPYADELRAGVSRLRFAPALEAAYRTLHLARAKLRARTWGVLSAFFAVLFTVVHVEQLGPLHPVSLLYYALTSVALLLAWLPCSRFYQSHFLPVAQYAYPLVACLTAPFSAEAAAQGRYVVLMQFALQIIGTFEFSGLLYRTALSTCIALAAGFAAGTIIWAIPVDAAIQYIGTLILAITLSAIAFRGAEITARTLFLEGHLLGELLDRDPLTGLQNRRSFEERLQRAWMQAQRDSRWVAILMVDVDEFKRYNDLYGHQAGDEALRRIGAVLHEAGRRPLDVAARYGGEEFVLILHDVTQEHARNLAEQLRDQVAALAIPHAASGAAAVVTLSIGVAVGQPAIGRTPDGLVQLADEALYEAKAAGRNRVVLKGPGEYRALTTGVFAISHKSG
jgi:diguanylate cyclase (GGDEF)-like protein